MITWKKAAGALLIASLLSSSMAPMAMAASKTKVGKISLTIDSDIRTGREGGDVEVTPTGDNTDRYYVDSWEVTNDNGDTWTRSNPPEIDIVLPALAGMTPATVWGHGIRFHPPSTIRYS